MTVLEIVTFRRVPGAADAAVLDAARAREPFLRRCDDRPAPAGGSAARVPPSCPLAELRLV